MRGCLSEGVMRVCIKWLNKTPMLFLFGCVATGAYKKGCSTNPKYLLKKMPGHCTAVNVLRGRIFKRVGSSHSCKKLSTLARSAVVHCYKACATSYSTCYGTGLVGTAHCWMTMTCSVADIDSGSTFFDRWHLHFYSGALQIGTHIGPKNMEDFCLFIYFDAQLLSIETQLNVLYRQRDGENKESPTAT